jgi:hypothetical protein
MPLRVVANRENVKHAVASNSLLQRILQRIYRFWGLKISDSAQIGQKILLAQGTSSDSSEFRANRLSRFGLQAVL